GSRLTLQVVNVGRHVEVQHVDRDQIPLYWAYSVKLEKQLFPKLVTNGQFDLVIATAKLGAKFAKEAQAIGERWRRSQHILVAFGAPSRGLHEIVIAQGARLKDIVDFVVNTIPE